GRLFGNMINIATSQQSESHNESHSHITWSDLTQQQLQLAHIIDNYNKGRQSQYEEDNINDCENLHHVHNHNNNGNSINNNNNNEENINDNIYGHNYNNDWNKNYKQLIKTSGIPVPL